MHEGIILIEPSSASLTAAGLAHTMFVCTGPWQSAMSAQNISPIPPPRYHLLHQLSGHQGGRLAAVSHTPWHGAGWQGSRGHALRRPERHRHRLRHRGSQP